MEYTKLPIDLPRQIEMLTERGLIIKDKKQALNQLRIISYFRLANYWRPLEQDKVSHRFKPNSYFENAIDLYYFDKELRTLVFTAIQTIEIALRTKIIHHFSLKFGAFWFMDEALFADKGIFTNCFNNIREELHRSKEDFIQEHFNRYDNPPYPPAWKTLEVVSLGTLSKLYCNLTDTAVKKRIAREFLLPQHLYLESWIKCAAVLRNYCAHHARIWNRRFPLKPQLPYKLASAWIDNQKTSSVKFYAQLCCLIYLQNSIYPDNLFKRKFLELLEAHPNIDVGAMGFPDGWQAEPIWCDKSHGA